MANFRSWLLDGLTETSGSHQGPLAKTGTTTHAWWRVMCLTGVDYFSTLGYQPAIAALAAGLISPFATLVLVVLTLAGALPVYRRVARESHRGEGSIAMLEKLLPWWGGKLIVLVLLGFAATDFTITMTLSAADASAHAIENPFAPDWFHGNEVLITLALLALLGFVFLRGFTEAIRLAVWLVAAFLALNIVVVVVSLVHVVEHAESVTDWWSALTVQNANPLVVVGIALLVFPKLALGLSGFETGVAVMPQITGEPGDTDGNPAGRIRGSRRLLTSAAVIMSVFLIASSFITTVLIPQSEFQPGGAGTDGLSPILRTSTSATDLGPRTTSARYSFCGLPGRRPWPGSSTSYPDTCLAMGWRRSGRAPSDRSFSSSPRLRS